MIDTSIVIAVANGADAGFAVLLDIAIKGTLLLLAAGLVTIMLSRRSAAHRHAVWTAAMFGLLLLPIVAALVPGRAWRVLPNLNDRSSAAVTNIDTPAANAVVQPPSNGVIEQAMSNPTPSSDVESSAQQNQVVASPESQNLSQQNTPSPVTSAPAASSSVATGAVTPTSTTSAPFHHKLSLTALILLAWATGAWLCLLALCVDLLALKWMAARAVQITRGPWMETFDRVRQGISLPPVMLLERAGSGMPLACGIVAPTLVLPGEAHTWPEQRRHAVLAHELAHVNRRDCATQLLSRLACAIHWFNPLAWYAARRMRVERERACDDLVIGSARGGRRGAAVASQPDAAAAEYASHLLEVARSLRAARLGALAGVAMARPSQLEGRLLAVLDQQKDHRPVGSRFVAGGIVTVLVAIGLLAFVRLAPRAIAQESTGAPRSTAQAPNTPQPPAANRAQQPPTFANGQKVEVKWGGLWRKAVVVNHRGQWLLIDYDGNKFFREWVEPWRVRSIGSAYDISGSAPINPYVHHNEGPPQAVPGPAPVEAADTGAGAKNDDAQSDVPITPVVRQNAQLISLDMLQPLQSLPADAAPPAQWTTSPISLQGSSGKFFDHPEALLLSPASGIGAVYHFNAPPGNAEHQYRVERFDLKAGKSLNVSTLPLELELLDLSSDGRLLLARTGAFGPGHGARLDVWQIDGEKAVHVITFMPFTARTGGEKVVWAKFVGPDHILARSFDGELSCYAFKTATQLWSAKPGLTNTNVLSATGKYVAASTGKSIAILEPVSGRVLGGIDLDGCPAQSLAFKPDGKAIAAAGQDEVAAWDLSKGAIISDSWAVGAPGQHVEWGQGNYVLLDHAHLVSLDKQLAVWTYEGVAPAMHGQLAQVWNGRMYYTADAASPGAPHRPVVASVALPDERVAAKIVVSGEPKLALKPGSSVSLDVQVPASIRQQVIDSLTSKLKDNGVTIVNDAPVSVTVKEEPGETREISYRRIGFRAFGQTDKVRVKEVKRLIAISIDGQAPAWQRGGTMMPPMFLSLKEGQSIDQAVNDAMKPSPLFYQSVRIPKLIPEQPDGFGVTPLSATGPQAARPPRARPIQKAPVKPVRGTQVRGDAVSVGGPES